MEYSGRFQRTEGSYNRFGGRFQRTEDSYNRFGGRLQRIDKDSYYRFGERPQRANVENERRRPRGEKTVNPESLFSSKTITQTPCHIAEFQDLRTCKYCGRRKDRQPTSIVISSIEVKPISQIKNDGNIN